MSSNKISELATLNFYQWDYLGRGYYHFETPVDIEPPYTRFSYYKHLTQYIDDGRVSNIFQKITSILNPPKNVPTYEELVITPSYLTTDSIPNLSGFSLSFSNAYEIRHFKVLSFLNTLSFTTNSISFEIIGSFESIIIQMVACLEDCPMLEAQLKAFFPNMIITKLDGVEFSLYEALDIAIADFGLNEEFARSIAIAENYSVDPLTSIIGSLEQLQEEETAIVQIIFKGATAPWARDITTSVSNVKGESFFVDAPEMPKCAKEKITQPLFSVVTRIVAQGTSLNRTNYLTTQLARHVTTASTSKYNKLIPLSNEGYDFDFHYYNVQHRTTNRLGCILNTKELATLVHYPNKTIVSEFLQRSIGKTRAIPKHLRNQKYVLGENLHRGARYNVSIADEHKLRHGHLIGATGVGKSTLIANMVIEDMNQGNGVFLFDPHGDIVEDVLMRIPEQRIDDVIVVDPYDTESPIGFNLLHATTDAEKIVLSSDLVSAFKRFATSWGDNMSSVLSQAVNTFLESSQGGTLMELKRFLLEDGFRYNFLNTVNDPSIHYYWNNEYKHLKNRISPLLTRIDTFLRPKIIRYMLVQKQGLSFKDCIEQKKIVLLKLSQGLIGEENSYLLGALFLSKINQVALGRQALSKNERHPFYVYLDEFHNFITPSLSSILSGARKYGLGIFLAHQELAQIDDYQILNAVLSNPNIRICFKLGDADAKRLQDGFAHFESKDLQSLGIGSAIMRVGSSNDDFNITTFPLPEIDDQKARINKTRIIENTRSQYCQLKDKVERDLEDLLPKIKVKKSEEKKLPKKPSLDNIEVTSPQTTTTYQKPNPEFENQKEEYLHIQKERERSKKHLILQKFIKTVGIQFGFKASIEHQIEDGKYIDVVLTRESIRIAIEISVTNTVSYEVNNIKKCIDSKFQHVYMLCEDNQHLEKIRHLALDTLPKKEENNVVFCHPNNLMSHLQKFESSNKSKRRQLNMDIP